MIQNCGHISQEYIAKGNYGICDRCGKKIPISKMTNQQTADMIKVCGVDFEDSEIPAIWRNRDLKNEMIAEAYIERMSEENRQEEIEDERFDYHPHWSEEI